MSRNAWLIFVAVCVVILGGLIWMSSSNRADVSNINHLEVQPASEESGEIADWVKGDKDAPVTILEYADFQCPGCASAAPVLDEVVEKNKDVRLVFRHFPLPIHPNARAAAAAAEAAGMQDKFWEMNKLVFSSRDEWSNLSGERRTDAFAGFAANLGLDREKFLQDMTSDAITKKINYDRALGANANVDSTPTVFVNGQLISDKYFSGDEIVDKDAPGAKQVLYDADAINKLFVVPAVEKAKKD